MAALLLVPCLALSRFSPTKAVCSSREAYECCALLTCEVRRRLLVVLQRHTDSHIAGNLQSLNQLAADARANYIIHTGDFGFYDDRSLDRIADKYVQRTHVT